MDGPDKWSNNILIFIYYCKGTSLTGRIGLSDVCLSGMDVETTDNSSSSCAFWIVVRGAASPADKLDFDLLGVPVLIVSPSNASCRAAVMTVSTSETRFMAGSLFVVSSTSDRASAAYRFWKKTQRRIPKKEMDMVPSIAPN